MNGFIVPEQNSRAIYEALKQLIKDPELHELLGENAKKIVAFWDYERNVIGYQEAIDYVTED